MGILIIKDRILATKEVNNDKNEFSDLPTKTR